MPRAAYAVALHAEQRFATHVKRQALAALARRALAAEEVQPPAELSIVVTDDGTIRKLNQRYRSLDEPTDVLSFSLDADGDFATPPGSPRQLGEIVISYPTAARQAEEAGHGVDGELAHLLVHGVLHLLGHDHESPAAAKAMRAREEELLGRAVH